MTEKRRFTYYRLLRPNNAGLGAWVDAISVTTPNMTPFEGAVVRFSRPYSAVFRRGMWCGLFTWSFSRHWFSELMTTADEDRVLPLVTGLLIDNGMRAAWCRGLDGGLQPCATENRQLYPDALLNSPGVVELVNRRLAGAQ